MISKETFCKVIDEVQAVNERIDNLQEVNSGLALSFVEEYSIQDELISVLEEDMNLYVDPKYGSTISWWIYETNFGKDSPYIWLNKGKKDEEKLILDTVEKLYDYCVKEGKSNSRKA